MSQSRKIRIYISMCVCSSTTIKMKECMGKECPRTEKSNATQLVNVLTKKWSIGFFGKNLYTNKFSLFSDIPGQGGSILWSLKSST